MLHSDRNRQDHTALLPANLTNRTVRTVQAFNRAFCYLMWAKQDRSQVISQTELSEPCKRSTDNCHPTTRHGKSENRSRQSELLEPGLAKSENNNVALLSDRNQQDNTASLPPISQTELSEPRKRSTEPRQCKVKQEWKGETIVGLLSHAPTLQQFSASLGSKSTR